MSAPPARLPDEGSHPTPPVTAVRGVDPQVEQREIREQRRALRGKVDGVGAVLAGGANVVLQLSWPEVGRGVLESPVKSGSVRHHPIKRTRTTLTYIAVAMYGDADTRAAYREAVNGSHRQVRSAPGAEVRYNAFDRRLQLWVASCLYYGARDMAIRMHGELDDETERMLLEVGKRFGTTLQVPEEMWHEDTEDFQRYWAEGIERASMDQETKRFLRGIINASVLPSPVGWVMSPVVRFYNTGFLPPELREILELDWSSGKDLAHIASLRMLGAGLRLFPDFVRSFPFNALLLDVKVRRRLGKRLV